MRTDSRIPRAVRSAVCVSWLAVLFFIPSAPAQTGDAAAAVDFSKVPSVKELANPLIMNNGKTVQSRTDWPARRAEIKELLLHYEYGHPAPAPDNLRATEATVEKVEGIDATERQAVLSMGPEHKLSFKIILTVPEGKGPFPVVLKGDLCWGRVAPSIVASVANRGYILAEFDRTEVASDSADRSKGVYPLYPEYDWAALSAWAWGYQRAVDYLITQSFVDKKRIVATGHSRGGKAVLLAGALDERIAVTAPNGSGCGGAGCYRIQGEKSETIGDITRKFPYWFHPRFPAFVGHVDQIPFDQHFLRALVAPRALLSTEALGDLWANPSGTQASYLAARAVFEFLGAANRQGIHFREGKHQQNVEDWNVLLDFADLQLFGKAAGTKFDRLPFPVPEGSAK